MSTTKILSCKCPSEFQDREYGLGQRLHNRCRPKILPRHWRCTICQDVKDPRS